MPDGAQVHIRPADRPDRGAVLALVRTQDKVHAHLDWKPVEDWLGSQPFLLAERAGRVVGVLACPPDPADTAWLRLLAMSELDRPAGLWQALWERARAMLVDRGVRVMAALSVDGWIDRLCLAAGFEQTHSVVVLMRHPGPLPATAQVRAAKVRLALPSDHAAIKAVDAAAFTPPWQMSSALMDVAIESADLLTVAEIDGRIVGYQLTTPGHYSAHLARLAVLPDCQKTGVGASLLSHLVEYCNDQGTHRITLNTQDSNSASLHLYGRFGFRPTGAVYPVFQCALP
jgi:[ribosomal protein S18]-alanine N-acetyltransferase